MSRRIKSLQLRLTIELAALFFVASCLAVGGLIYSASLTAGSLADRELGLRAEDLARHVFLDEAGRPRLDQLLELLRLPAHQFVKTPAVHFRVKHFQGSAAGVDLIVMGEFGEPFEDAEQLLVPRAAPDLHIAGTALRAEWPEARQLAPC